MKKMIYFLLLSATLSLVASCKDKKKDGGDDEEPDMTLVVTGPAHFLA